MNYLKVYNSLIHKRQVNILKKSKELYTELHHIIPRSCSGKDDKSNLIRLTAREHYIAHLLLCKIYYQNKSILSAFMAMHWGHLENRNFKYNSKLYEIYKKKFANFRSTEITGKNNPVSGKIWIYNSENRKQRILWDPKYLIPYGWYNNKYNTFLKEKTIKFKNNNKTIIRIDHDGILSDIIERQKSRRLNKIYMMYNWYKRYGFSGVVKQFNYKKSQPCFLQLLRINIPQYKNDVKHPGISYYKNKKI